MDRRDFLNGILLTVGSVALGTGPHVPVRSERRSDINLDPRAFRGGNLPDAFSVAHWMRDRRLSWQDHTVTLAPGADGASGTFGVIADTEQVDVIIVGSGIAALSAAVDLTRQRPSIRLVLLDANRTPGGNSAQDDTPGLPVAAATGAAYGVAPYADFLHAFYRNIGLDWEKYVIPAPVYSYFVDSHTPHALPNAHGWVTDVYAHGLAHLPYPADILRDLQAARQDIERWANVDGGPTDPADDSDPRYDYLAGMSFAEYIEKTHKWHPAVSDFYTCYTVDALGAKAADVNAYSALSFLGAEYRPMFAMPGGNAGITAACLRALQGTSTRVQQSTVVLRADTAADGASVDYYHDRAFRRMRAKAVILATQSHASRHVVEHLADDARRAAWRDIVQVPVVTANVVIRDAAPLVDLGVGYNQYWWGSKFWADFATADWVSGARAKRDRQTVLTFYGGNWEPPAAMPAERWKLMTRPFADYENSLREDTDRIFAGTGFDFDRDVSAIYVYRWGHGMLFPKPGFPFAGGTRAATPRLIARAPMGRISFAGQDTEGAPSLECAIASGGRAAREILARM